MNVVKANVDQLPPGVCEQGDKTSLVKYCVINLNKVIVEMLSFIVPFSSFKVG